MRCVLLAVATWAACSGTAFADIRLIDPGTGTSTVLVKDDTTRLLTALDDGLLVKQARGGATSLVALDGSATAAPRFGDAQSVGPGGRTLGMQPPGYALRAADGRVLGTYAVDGLVFAEPEVAWSADGTRVAVLVGEQLRVLDTATGAALVEEAADGRLDAQAFSADASALLYARERRVERLDIASGQTSDLGQAAFAASWSSAGQVALTRERGIAVLGAAGVRAPTNVFFAAQWSPDGRTLAFSVEQARDECSAPLAGVAVAAPGGTPRVLVKPSDRGLRGFTWAPDGRLAVDREADLTPEGRGKRHPWPKRVGNDYAMFSPRGDAAVRHAVVRAAASLKRGASRETALSRLRLAMAEVQERYDETDDSAVGDAIAEEIDRWLSAAGFVPVESSDEVMC